MDETSVSPGLGVDEYLALLSAAYPQRAFDRERLGAALGTTINLAARVGDRLAGAVRVLTDGYLFSTIPEVVVHPDWRGHGVGRQLMLAARAAAPTPLFFGAKPGREAFFEKCGFRPGMQSFQG